MWTLRPVWCESNSQSFAHVLVSDSDSTELLQKLLLNRAQWLDWTWCTTWKVLRSVRFSFFLSPDLKKTTPRVFVYNIGRVLRHSASNLHPSDLSAQMTTAPYSYFSFSTLLISLIFFNGSLLPAWVETLKEADWLPDVEANNEGFESNLCRTDMTSPLEISVNQVVFANLVRKMQNMSKASPFHWPNPYQTTTSPSYINIFGLFFFPTLYQLWRCRAV